MLVSEDDQEEEDGDRDAQQRDHPLVRTHRSSGLSALDSGRVMMMGCDVVGILFIPLTSRGTRQRGEVIT